MHPRRPDIEAALTDLRTRVLGGKIVGAWGLEPPWRTQGPRQQRDAWLDSLAEALEAALTRKAFEPITVPDGRSPSHWECILAHALVRHGGPVASFPHFSETRRREGETVTTLGTAHDKLVIYPGPLELHGHVDVLGTIVVLGDLIVHGSLMDGDPSDSALLVMGNQRVRALYAGANHLVVGDLEADLMVPSGWPESRTVGGEVRARLRLEGSTVDEEARRWLEPLPPGAVLASGGALCREVGSGRTKVRPPP